VNITSPTVNQPFVKPEIECIESPRTYNQKIFKLAKELRERELKVLVLKNFLNFENVYDKANSAIEDGYINGDIFPLANNIKHFKGGSLEKWMEVIMQKECNNMKPKWNPFNWQGRRKDQVEFSENVVAFSISIIIIIVLSILANALV
jgi:hypothetical protein